MLAPYDYAWEKLLVATQILARGNDILRSRLSDAYMSSLIRLRIEDGGHEFPQHLVPVWLEIERQFETATEYGSEGRAEASVMLLDDNQARELAEKIVGLFADVCAHRGVDD